MGANLITIVADSAAEALAEIHRQLGPSAIVVNVRKTSAPGLSGIWKKGKIEVQATLPALPAAAQPPKKEAAPVSSKSAKRDEFRSGKSAILDSPMLAARRRALASRLAAEHSLPVEPIAETNGRHAGPPLSQQSDGELDLAKMLENLGILPLHAQSLVDQVRSRKSERSNRDLREEFRTVQELLLQRWEQLAVKVRSSASSVRILVGAPGVGKTTCLCKWLTQDVLLKNQAARVWRLDTHTANTAEFLSIHGEILGVPVERILSGEATLDKGEIQFVDVPGVMPDDSQAIAALGEQFMVFNQPQVLLVLNAAYELNHQLAQARGFASLPLAGIVLTHLDEESRWSKFWNLLMATNLPILFLSGGQNIPGQFLAASPQSLFEVLPDQAED